MNLVRVFDRLASAENREDQHMALDDLGKLKKARQDQYVRWTMDRHVLKVRRIAPCNIQLPQKGDYCTVDENGQGHINWAAYGQHVRRFLITYFYAASESFKFDDVTKESIC